jgi:ElaB/YqjD/DUF883 family membrane-anchored ribosome-binding protein
MRRSDLRGQLDTALSNVESALRDLSDRLEDILPDDGGRRRMRRAGRALRRTAHQVVERVRPHNGGDLIEDTRRTMREHPVGTVITAALVGGLVWAVLRAGNSHHAGWHAEEERSLAGRFRHAMGRDRETESSLRH